MHTLELRGCTPEPLGNYLKGLGVFRLIAEQADPLARAWWKNGVLHILQHKWLDKTSANVELACWLLKACRFTPLIAPWQKGTGYLPIGKRVAGGVALRELLGATHNGTEYFRDVFRCFAAALGIGLGEDASKWPDQMQTARTDLSDAHLLRILRNRMTSAVGLKWLDAVGLSASRSTTDDVPKWFPILASGGGEASGQYIVNHQQRLKSALLDDQDQSKRQLEASLFAENRAGALQIGVLSAMYYPAYVKNWNSSQNFLPDGQRFVNPWDFILLLEGTLVWSLAATKRNGVTKERASFPFYCRGSFGGSPTIGPKEVEGAEKSIANGELWCPIWDGPCTLAEIERIFGEGRIQVSDRPATRSLDFALAMRGLGIDRGIRAFFRYSLLERSGSGRQTTLLAVPSGKFVPENEPVLHLVAELRSFAEEVTNYLCDNGQQPRRLLNARIAFERAWYGATSQRSDCRAALLELLVTAGRLMSELGANSAKPGIVKLKQGENTVERVIPTVPSLDPGWCRSAAPSRLDSLSDSEAIHFRVARAIAGIAAWGESSEPNRPAVEAIRSNLLPVRRRGRAWKWDETNRGAVWSRGASLSANLTSVLRRRLIDAQRGKGEGLPLWSQHGAPFSDLVAYWNGKVDEGRLGELIHGLALLDPGPWDQDRVDDWQQKQPERCETPDIDTSQIYFVDDIPKGKLRVPQWLESDFDAACELPRVYHLMKLCFVGSKLPRRPVEGESARRTGKEPFPPDCLDILSLLEAERLADAAQLAGRRLRAKGYPAILRHMDIALLPMRLDCRRLASMMLIPVEHPGVSAALAIRPESITA
ncbi:MAG: type I-U CRISPR-associated protein Csx17 [Planctomycetes bacterium]|nr:type I-U CRISPR-associated protein Csx17 [Planctomycetota bacterium]